VDAHEVNRARAKLALFVADVFTSIPRKDQRAKTDCYLRGLMLDGRRKSIQAMASRLTDGNEQNLQQFVNQSTWDPVPVRRRIAQRMVPLIGPDAWAVDDVSFPKDGRMSVAVAHQYRGALGKQANCQVAVSVHAVTDAASVPLQWRLFLPKVWDSDAGRRLRCQVPDEAGHRTAGLEPAEAAMIPLTRPELLRILWASCAGRGGASTTGSTPPPVTAAGTRSPQLHDRNYSCRDCVCPRPASPHTRCQRPPRPRSSQPRRDHQQALRRQRTTPRRNPRPLTLPSTTAVKHPSGPTGNISGGAASQCSLLRRTRNFWRLQIGEELGNFIVCNQAR
jgi:hypothetical protein